MSKLIVNSIEPQVGFTSVTFTTEINTTSVNVTGISTFSDINVKGAIYDSTGSVGQANQVLVSNAGAGVTWSQVDSIPTGVIVMWSGSIATIPSGWALCNGTNGTPDLRNRFIVGAGNNYAVDNSGGSADAIVVSHTHSLTIDSVGDHSHSYSGGDRQTFSGGGVSQPVSQGGNTTGSAGAHTHTGTASATGSSGTNANLPPYYALAYIMKT